MRIELWTNLQQMITSIIIYIIFFSLIISAWVYDYKEKKMFIIFPEFRKYYLLKKINSFNLLKKKTRLNIDDLYIKESDSVE